MKVIRVNKYFCITTVDSVTILNKQTALSSGGKIGRVYFTFEATCNKKMQQVSQNLSADSDNYGQLLRRQLISNNAIGNRLSFN